MSARLNMNRREEIVDALINHAFNKRREAHKAWAEELAEAAWKERYSDAEQKLLREAPDGFFDLVNSFVFRVDGSSLYLSRLTKYWPIAHSHRSNYFCVPSPELHARLSDWKHSKDKMVMDQDSARSSAQGTLAKFRTLAQLRKGWPELLTLCPKLLEEDPPSYPVAISTAKLNSTFKLPVEKEIEA